MPSSKSPLSHLAHPFQNDDSASGTLRLVSRFHVHNFLEKVGELSAPLLFKVLRFFWFFNMSIFSAVGTAFEAVKNTLSDFQLPITNSAPPPSPPAPVPRVSEVTPLIEKGIQRYNLMSSAEPLAQIKQKSLSGERLSSSELEVVDKFNQDFNLFYNRLSEEEQREVRVALAETAREQALESGISSANAAQIHERYIAATFDLAKWLGADLLVPLGVFRTETGGKLNAGKDDYYNTVSPIHLTREGIDAVRGKLSRDEAFQAIASMTLEEQISPQGPLREYFQKWREHHQGEGESLPMLRSLSDVYVTVFAPARLKDAVLYSKKENPTAYESNKSLDTSVEKGEITREELTDRARMHLALYQYGFLQRYFGLQ